MLQDLDDDPDASIEQKLACYRTMNGSLRLLSRLTGEASATDATIATSTFYRRVRVAVVDALRAHPNAVRDVIAALERVERGTPDLEAAAE